MPPKLKTDAERQQLRNLIIDNARELFISRGAQAVTMREIAKRIGYSATSIYHHFEDKESLIRAICDTDFLALASSLKAVLQLPHPVERMLALCSGYAAFALSHPNHYRLRFMTDHPPIDPVLSSLKQKNVEQVAYFQLKSVVKRVYDAGYFRPNLYDVDLIAQTIWAAIHGVCSLQITMAQDTWVKWANISARLDLMQQMITHGLLKDGVE